MGVDGYEVFFFASFVGHSTGLFDDSIIVLGVDDANRRSIRTDDQNSTCIKCFVVRLPSMVFALPTFFLVRATF
ncbi:hypothetical protein AFLA_007911 [Aspergillus flavus NRRL3357]|nr:hypothetical protein AFLA_007911 [Aspergillus flavus NRRL3357]